MKKLIKQISYSVFGLLALISTFLAYSTLTAQAVDGSNPVAIGAAKQYNENLKANDSNLVKFFEYIGDFCDKSTTSKAASTIISAIFLLIAVLCVGIMLYTVIMSFIKKDAEVLDQMHIKWVSVAAFAACLISLLIALIFPDLPEGASMTANGLIEYKAGIGVGSILFLIGTGLAAIFSFVHPKLLKD